MHRRWGIPRDLPHVHRFCDEPGTYTSPSADSSASAHSRAAAYSSANTSSAAADTAPVLHWSRRWVQCPLLFGRVVWRERIQLQGLRRQLVRRLFTDSSTNACGEPNSYTSGSDTGRQPDSHSTGAYTEFGVRRMQAELPGSLRELWRSYDQAVLG